MKIAIIGAGISGLAAAYGLRRDHDVHVFEANKYVGGHTNTIDVAEDDGALAIDTGFIVFNDRTYPNFSSLLKELDVASQASDMSFSVRCDRSGLEYAGTGLNGLFAQRTNAFRPRFWRLLADWRRFARQSVDLLADTQETQTVGEFFAARKYSREFREQYFYPIGSSIWSCPHATFDHFPMRFIVAFYENHGLLTLADPPQWRVVSGGSRTYVDALLECLPRPVQASCPISAVARNGRGVTVYPSLGPAEEFDHVILAVHADQALRMLGERASFDEREILGAFPYEANVATLHTDVSVLPKLRRAWASWNYRIPSGDATKATLTYDMTRLQNLPTEQTYCVSLNEQDRIDPAKVIRQITYHHPTFSLSRRASQRRHPELLCRNGLSFCGAYWGNGFHEDGVNSAIAVCDALKQSSRVLIPAEECAAGE